MRFAFLLALGLLLSACSGGAEPEAVAGDKIACALGDKTAFARNCVVERVQRNGRLMLVVHHPDGGFRRFEVLKDGRGLALADGSRPMAAAVRGQFLEVRVGEDRYRFPYTASAKNGGPGPQASIETKVGCAPRGAKSYGQQCLLERAPEGLVLRHPDGGFRRFTVKGGRITTADGADVATTDGEGGDVALSVGNDSYLIPKALLADAGE